MSNINISDKNTGDQLTAAEFNTVKNFINSPEASLGTLNPASMTFEETGYYSAYTQTAAITFTISGTPTGGVCQVFKFTSDGANTISFDTNFEASAIYGVTPGNTLDAGDYWIYMLCINDKIHVNVKT